MKHAILLLFILTFVIGFSSDCFAETTANKPNTQDSLMIWDKLIIKIDPKINDLLRQQTAQSKKKGTIDGFRLQIYFGSGEKAHDQAIKIKTDFLASYPVVKAYLLFKSPDFIVRIGDFRTKSEALKMQKMLLFQFPNAFIVADEIAFPELVINTTIN